MGNPVVITTYVDENLCHYLTNGREVTGVLHFFNQYLVDFFTKHQPTVETATYG